MLASLNRSMLDVYRKPQVAIVATGDELVDVDQIPTGAQIVNSSAYALAAAITEAGGDPTILKIARDTIEDTRERLSEAMRFDVVFSTGGVSAGDFDHVKGVMDEMGMRVLFHGVAQRPGRPLKFGIMAQRPVFGLPGNPVSTMVCFYLYARPALRKMGGFRRLGLPRVNVVCGADIKVAKDLTEFVRVRLERKDGEIYATPTGNQGSGILSSLSRADALLIGSCKGDVCSRRGPRRPCCYSILMRPPMRTHSSRRDESPCIERPARPPRRKSRRRPASKSIEAGRCRNGPYKTFTGGSS